MDKKLLYPIGTTDSCRWASVFLQQSGFALTDHPSPDITHLLLDVPSFTTYKESDLLELLRMLPKNITVIGGFLGLAALETYHKIDLLTDPYYLAKNAAITAECALQAAAPHLNTTFADSPALVLGWGRIGKCLTKLLSALGCSVTVAARNISDRAILEGLGYKAVDFSQIPHILCHCRILFNTVPNPTLASDTLDLWKNGIALDLASYPGITGKNVIPARGLPGKYAPESAGNLIAQSILRINKEEAL